MLAGAGLALNTAPAVGLAMSAVPMERSGLASGVVNLARLVGITVGVAVLGSAMAAVGGADGDARWAAVAEVQLAWRCRRLAIDAFGPTRDGRRRPAMRDGAELAVRGDAGYRGAGRRCLPTRPRCKVLLALDDGRALPASVLADEAGVSRPTASSHLGKLTDAGLLTVETSRPSTATTGSPAPRSASCWSSLVRLAPPRPVRVAARGHPRGSTALGPHLLRPPRRHAWVCRSWAASFDRGVLCRRRRAIRPAAVTRRDALSSPGHDIHYELTDAGRGFLSEVGVELPTGRRPLVRYCVDWTEQRHHLSGALGRAVLDRFVSAGG